MQQWEAVNREVSSLRSVVRTLERSTQQLQADKSQLAYELQDARHYHKKQEEEIKRLTALAEGQTATIQRMAADHAEEVVSEQLVSKREIANLRAMIDRLSGQLSLSNNPRDGQRVEPQPLPWQLVAKIPSHPIHIIRKIVLADQRREELGTIHIRSDNEGDDGYDEEATSSTDLDVLLSSSEKHAAYSEDDTTWRSICRRLHQVLTDRRRVHHLLLEETPIDIMLRTRHSLVAEWAALHADIARIQRNMLGFVAYIQNAITTPWNDSSSKHDHHRVSTDLGRHADSLSSSLSDMMYQCSKVRETCFTDVDRAFHAVVT